MVPPVLRNRFDLAAKDLCRESLGLRKLVPPLPRLWILSSGSPDSAIEGFGFEHREGSPPGMYLAPPRLFTGLLVISELLPTRDTLLLRLMGAGRTLERAIAELKALPPEAPEAVLALPVLLRYRLEVPADPAKRTSDDEEFLMSTHEIVEAWKREQRQEGRHEALQLALVDLYEARFGALPADLAAIIRATQDEASLRGWHRLAATGTAADVACDVAQLADAGGAGSSARAAPASPRSSRATRRRGWRPCRRGRRRTRARGLCAGGVAVEIGPLVLCSEVRPAAALRGGG
jgi:hypothetical protein